MMHSSSSSADAKTNMQPLFSTTISDPSLASGGSENGDSSSAGDCEAEDQEAAPVVLSASETLQVNRLKLAVFVVLVTSALVAALSVYLYLSHQEDKAFQRAFADDSNKILDAIGGSLDRLLGSMDALAVTFIAHARTENQTWPFVTLPNFGLRMAKVLPLSEATILNVLPLVKAEQRAEWEAYSVEHDYWVDEAMAVQATWDDFYGPIVYGGQPNLVVQGDFGEIPRNTSRDMLPLWQNFPVLANTTYAYNYDYLSMSKPEPLYECLETHRAVISIPYLIPLEDDEQAQMETDIWVEFFRSFVGPDEEVKEPMSDLFYPIIDDTSRVNVLGVEGYEPDDHVAVGLIAAQYYWRTLIRNALPYDSHGIHVVFTTPCSNNFTYEIRGPDVGYLGVGDLHERAYDSMQETARIHELGQYSSRQSHTSYSGAILDNEFCPMTLHLYPSDTMKSRFTTINPILFTVGTIVIFAFTSLVLYFYDSKVEERQRRVLKTAVDSSAIVSSLYPSTVRDRLFSPATTIPEAPLGVVAKRRSSLLQGYMRGFETAPVEMPEAEQQLSGSPIAELYPDTTVLFADIAGFTAWSNCRTPTEVFILLETLYGAFDAIARQHDVFKVETIGDCYLAVVGLPKPRRHHAIVMVQFADDCRSKMKSLLLELEKTLGPGTADLAMRIGVNSGPTTAGVLRGEKSRFQLFGDTVNTAARMESNGAPDKIQVSQATAELIKLGGKEHWLTQRTGTVDCKGKGQLTCYWCDPKDSNNSSFESDVSCTEDTTAAADADLLPSNMSQSAK